MYKLVILFFFISCSTPASINEKVNLNKKPLYINVVEKSLSLPEEISLQKKIIFEDWFNKIFKINGFNGELIVKISKLEEELVKLDQGERFNLYIECELIELKELLSSRKKSTFNVSEYSQISGSYTRNEFDTLISNTYIRSLNKLRDVLEVELSN